MNLLEAQSVIVFGGTFDPPTLAHVKLPLYVREKLDYDLVAYVPAARSPHKPDQEPAPAEHRVEMLELALKGVGEAKVLTEEIDRAEAGQPSYTVDTLETLRDYLAPDTQLRLLIGSDQVLSFSKWKAPERIVELADPLGMIRPPETRESLLAQLPEQQRGFWAHRLIEVPAMELSSSDARRRVAEGKPLRDLVPPAVEQYIRKNKLYRNATPAT